MSLAPGTLTRAADLIDPPPHPYATDPAGWLEARLGERWWSKQRTIVESVSVNRYTAVPSAHGVGKSHAASRLVAWWIDVHPRGEAFAVATAPTQPQVETVLFRELGRAHRKAQLDGRITGGGVPAWKIDDEIVAYGRKPADYVDRAEAAAAFQGIHARYVLVVIDEAGGVPAWLFEAADTLATNENARILAIGNPTDPTSEFAKVCAPGSGWNVIPISAFDTPAFTGEAVPGEVSDLLVSPQWVEERRRRWGEGSPTWKSRVLGEFPKVATDTLIPPAWIIAAQERTIEPSLFGTYGVDVARSGDDETVIYRNAGGHARLARTPDGRPAAWRGHDTMRTAGEVAAILDVEKGGESAVIDVIGIGAGVFDRLRERSVRVRPFNAAERAWRPDQFANRRAESYWRLREVFERGEIDIDPDDDELAAQLGSIQWRINSSGRTQIESKEEMRKRGLPSPDRADALCMATTTAAPTWVPPTPSTSAASGLFESELGPLDEDAWQRGMQDALSRNPMTERF